MYRIIGRKQEIAELTRAYESGRAEFVAVYGRRRVGKTFLINEVFHEYMTFHHTGLSPYDRKRKTTLRDQLQNFHFSLIRHGMEGGEPPQSWMEAFFRLEQFHNRTMGRARSFSSMNCRGWTLRALAFLLLLKLSGTDGLAAATIYAWLFAARQPRGCLTIS